MKKIVILTLVIHIYNSLLCQKEGNVWYFGNNAGISFNSSPPTALTNGQLSQREGCSSVCDKNGNLLFYTDGQKVFDKTHTLMSNGSGLLGNNSSCQSGVIVPWPDSTYKYFIISVDAIENSATNGVRYSVVDLRLNGGKGDIVSGAKNIILVRPQCEKATAVLHCNKRDFWLVTNQASSDSILSFAITPSGINKKAIRSNTGYSLSGNLNNNLGYINPSHDGTKLATCHFQLDKFLLMDFDNQTGKVSNAKSFTKPAAYCAEFSPNDKILYVSGLRNPTSIDQFDISSNNQSTIQSTMKQIFNYGSGEMGALKLASNGKIYATSETTTNNYNTYLGVINTPDSIGPYYNPKGIYLNGKTARLGLPNIFYSTPILKNQFITVKDTCFNSSTTINLISGNTSGTVNWDFGDPASGSNNSASGYDVSHTFTNPGKYKVKAIFNYSCSSDTILRDIIIINNAPKISLGNDTAVCFNTNLTIQPDLSGLSYQWSTGETTKSITVNKKGQYWVKVQFNCGVSIDTIDISEKTSNGNFTVSKDTLFCNNISQFPLMASSTIPHQTLWSTSETKDTIYISTPGNYMVTMKHFCGSYTDTVKVSLFSKGAPLRDTSYCFPSTQVIQKNSVNQLSWSTGETTPSIQISQPGTYTVKETNRYCSHLDTVIIKAKTTTTQIFAGNDTVYCVLPIVQTLSINCPDQHTTLWSNGSTTDNITISNAGNYSVAVTNACATLYDTVNVDLFNNALDLGPDTSYCFSTDYIWDLPIMSNYTCRWQDGSTSNTFAAKHRGQFYATVSYGNCKVSDTINITGDDASDEIYIPNAFTPNADLLNEFFPFQTSEKPVDIELYNRWGEKIFGATQTKTGWDGTYLDHLVESGIYVYLIHYLDCSRKNIFLRGTFTVLY